MRSPIRIALILLAVAVVMTILFWWPLYGGGGFIGGDLYPYFFPQKAFYSDCLKAGSFPLWNDLAGFGYPVLGESQTGAAYPFHFVFYFCFELNTAYNIEHLLHYVLCFVATWLFARRAGLTSTGAFLATIVFTYGWFPPRACLEWAILTGAWLPVAMWCVESFLQERTWRYAIGLSAALGLQLLAGHFHLAFITQLLVVTYVACRLWHMSRRNNSTTLSPSSINANINVPSSVRSMTIGLALAFVAGVGLAAVQLLPTWELKQRSSRVVTGGDYDPAYGHMPPVYVTQLVAPWCWYSPQAIDEDNFVRLVAECVAPWHWFGPAQDAVDPEQDYDLDQAIQRSRFAALGTGTNKVEAHCYCGMIPVCLAVWSLVSWLRSRRDRSKHPHTSVFEQTRGYWFVAGLVALIYATGLLLPIGRYLPGFSYFRGPGRYGIVTTLSVALFAGQMLSQLSDRIHSKVARCLLLAVIFSSTIGDLWLVSRMVRYTVMTFPPRIAFREASEVGKQLMSESSPPRLLAPGPNVCNMIGVSCVPWYLGIAPAEYVEPQNQVPPIPKREGSRPTPCTPELLEWLGRSGVTHVLHFDPLDESSWKAELIWSGTDPFLNRVWGRKEPMYLYRFKISTSENGERDFPGRAYDLKQNRSAAALDWKSIPADARRYELKPATAGSAELVVTELDYPGWTARHGKAPLKISKHGMFQSVEVASAEEAIVFEYRPWWVYIGATVSVLVFLLLAFVAHMRFWHPKLVNHVIGRILPGTTRQ